MKTIEYIDAALKATKSKTYNQLAIKLEIPRQRFHEYTQGKARPDEYACTRIAVALGVDPALVIAEIAVEWEKNEEKRRWWSDFLRYFGRASVIGGMLVLIYIVSSPVAQAAGGAIHKPLLCELNRPLCELLKAAVRNVPRMFHEIARRSCQAFFGAAFRARPA